MLFTETNETNIKRLQFLFFRVFTADEAFFDNFFDCAMKPGMQVPLLDAF